LGSWVAGTFIFAAFLNWTVNGRSLLPLAPAVAILLARRWEANGRRHPRALQIGLAASALLAMLAAQADFRLAIAVRRSAEVVAEKYGQSRGTVWFEGHWGFQYYMQKLGADGVDFKHRRQLPGDIVVVPQHNTDVKVPTEENALRETIVVPNASGVATWDGSVGAGFYASAVGPLPFGCGAVSPENVFVFELKQASGPK
jgi:hypothetical protein